MSYQQSLPKMIGLVLVLLFLVGCGIGAATPTPPGAAVGTSVVIDTDTGADDVMAILYLLQRSDLNVEAITVAGTGLAYCDAGTRYALGLVALAGADDIPVACGREEPLQGSNAFPLMWRVDENSFQALSLPEGGTVSDQTAVELLISTIESSPQKVTLLTLGPLTNVAEALQQRPALVDNLEMIYIMGGAIDVLGSMIQVSLIQTNYVAEWNIWIDPHAANLVLESGAPITLVPLDATNQVPITIFFYEALKDNHATPEATAVYDLLTAKPSIYQGGTYFWDPLAAAILTDESLATFETRRLTVVEEGAEESGHTVVTDDGAEVRVAVSADALCFEEKFLSTLNGGVDVTITRRAADMTIRFDGSGCTYDGPETVSVGQLIANIDNQSQKNFGLAIVRLEEGKTFEDLDVWPSVDKPPWAELIIFAAVSPLGRSTLVADVTEGPIFLVCFTAPPEAKIGVLGPVEVRD